MNEEEAETKNPEDKNVSPEKLESGDKSETEDPEDEKQEENQKPVGKTFPLGVPKRYVLLFMVWLGFINIYSMRVNLNVAIVGMVNDQEIVKSGVSFVKVF